MFDAATGADAGKAESVVALTGNRRAVLAAANAALLGGVALLGRAVADAVRRPRPVAAARLWGHARAPRAGRRAQGDLRVGLVLAAAIFMGYLYQGPPFRCACRRAAGGPRPAGWPGPRAHAARRARRLSYLGLGEPLCFLAFGPFATCAFYLAQARPAARASPRRAPRRAPEATRAHRWRAGRRRGPPCCPWSAGRRWQRP